MALALFAALGFVAFWLGQTSGLARGRAAAASSLRRITFRRGTVNNARFSTDGNVILYDARWEGRRSEIFSARLDSVESQPTGIRGQLMATAQGEMLVLLPTRAEEILRIYSNDDSQLGRAALAGGPVRAISDNVGRADSVPGSGELALVRMAGDRVRLEFPVGKVLYAPPPPIWINSLRVSPRGDRVAFVLVTDHTQESGSIVVADREGKKTTLSAGWQDLGGLAWSPDGNEISFTGTRTGLRRALHAVALGGEGADAAALGRLAVPSGRCARRARAPDACAPRLGDRRPLPGRFLGARLLVARHDHRRRPVPRRKDAGISGRGEGGGPFQASYLRKTDGSAAVRLGDGFPMSLSEDGRFVVAAVDSPPPRRLVLIPTGAGESRTLPRGSVDKYQWALFAPEGTRIMFTGHEAGRPRRGFIQELPDGLPRAVTPEGTRVFAFSPDGQILAASSDLSSWALYPTEGGAPRPLPWLRPGETPIRWGLDPQSLYVRETATPARISRLDLRTGRRQPWRELMPNDRAGVLYVWMVQMTSDGHYYAYSYPRELSDLYLVEGLQ